MRHRHHILWILILAILLGVYAIIETNLRDKVAADSQSATFHVLPEKKIAPVLSLGFQNLWADVLLLQTQIYSYDHRENMTLERTHQLKSMVDLILALDPHYTVAARFGHFVLSSFGDLMGIVEANEILYKSWKRNPDEYRLPMYIGFNYYLNAEAPNQVVKWFRVALENPEAPRRLIWMVDMMLRSQSGDPKNYRIHKQAMCSMCEEAEDPLQIRHLCGRCKLYDILVQLNDLAQRFRSEQKQPLETPQDFVRTGYLAELPPCPEGGRWYIREDGVIDSTANIDAVTNVDRR